MSDPMKWTDAEIEQAARAICRARRGGGECAATDFSSDGSCPVCDFAVQNGAQARAALSAIYRCPEGYWLAPDEPSGEMIDAGCARQKQHDVAFVRVVSAELVCIIYRAMRDACKGRK